ncbi:MAG: Ig domain protein group 1 domain protein [Jatrophihabitantaceae bacterium]|nr:Ig domain protein group 1 domain protein [Jatrophihabitantaceae bacterium]
MKRCQKISRLLCAVAAVGTMALAAAGPATAGPSASSGGAAGSGYNAIPSKVSGNVPSVSFEGAPAKELGDLVTLGGKARNLDSMSVLFSSWSCEAGSYFDGNCRTDPGATFEVPITFTIYDSTGNVVLTDESVTMDIPYRPSASGQCTGVDAGKWYNSKDRTCYNGFPFIATVKMSAERPLPDQVIWSVQYNTTSSGYAPIGNLLPCSSQRAGCAYDSLNVGAFSYPNAPFTGADVDSDVVFLDGALQSGWTGNRPLGAIATR